MQDDPICVAAREEGKTVVTGLWVEHSFEIGMPVDPASVSFTSTFIFATAYMLKHYLSS